MSYLGLFVAAFLAATLLPAQSEMLLIYLLDQNLVPWLLLLCASLGNVLGSCANFMLGKFLQSWITHRRFIFTPDEITKARLRYHHYGAYSLLLSWVPIIGDPLTLIAGIMNERFWRFLLLVSIAKVGRYMVVYAIYLGVF